MTSDGLDFKLRCVAGAIFIAIDSLISYTSISRWVRRRWKELAAPGASQEELDKSVPMISMRIVGMIHILVQVQQATCPAHCPPHPADEPTRLYHVARRQAPSLGPPS